MKNNVIRKCKTIIEKGNRVSLRQMMIGWGNGKKILHLNNYVAVSSKKVNLILKTVSLCILIYNKVG
jgi:hypothetical protein